VASGFFVEGGVLTSAAGTVCWRGRATGRSSLKVATTRAGWVRAAMVRAGVVAVAEWANR